MNKLFILFLLLPVFCFGQWKYKAALFPSTYDTMSSITTKDTIEVRLGVDGLWGPWKQLTECNNDTADITGLDKRTETVKVYELADESWWTFTPYMQCRIRSHAGSDTISGTHGIGQLEGAVTLFIYPDTSGTNTDYGGSIIVGR